MSTNETLRIKNFAGIHEASFELSRMNIFIGPQASGKSICAKLLFYFKDIIRRVPLDIANEQTKSQMRSDHKDRFLKYFPSSCWGKGVFEVQYSFGELWVRIDRKESESSTINVTYSKYYDLLLQTGRKALKKRQVEEEAEPSKELDFDISNFLRLTISDKVAQEVGAVLSNQNYFIPAGRSFFSTMRSSVFTFLAGNVGIDPFLAEFGRLYENTRRFHSTPTGQRNRRTKIVNDYISQLICGTYKRTGNIDYIQSQDGRQVTVENSSSGQQEALPLALLLARIARTAGGVTRSTVFVEEPEAHLYPSAQREIVHLLSAVTDLSTERTSSQYVITTHSPYILSALNNLMYGGKIAREGSAAKEKATKLFGEAALIDPIYVRAYMMGDGNIKKIIDNETELVRASILDNVSGNLAQEFQSLVDIQFEDHAE